MKCKFGVAALLLFAAMASSLAQQTTAAPPKPVDPLQAEFSKLQKEYQTALSEYYKPFENVKTQEEAAKIKLDPEKNPAKAFLPKFQEFAVKAKASSAVAVQVHNAILDMAMQTDNRLAADNSLNELLNSLANEPGVTRSFYSLQGYAQTFLGGDQAAGRDWVIGKLKEFQANSKNRNVQAAALMSQADVWAPPFGQAVDQSKANDILNLLKNTYGDTPTGKRAEGRLFVISNLNIGQAAPDFDATDENGKAFKLSDYKGKVVVLDFWGFW